MQNTKVIPSDTSSEIKYINVHTHPLVVYDYSPFDNLTQILNNRFGWKIIKLIDRFTKKTQETAFMKLFLNNNAQQHLDIENAAFEKAFAHKDLAGYGLAGKVFNVGLTMNFDQAGFKDFGPQYNYDKQYAAARELKRNNSETFTPALSIDPRDPQMMMRAETHWLSGFRTFKIYPSLGFTAYDKRLMDEFYPWAQERHASIITHSGKGGFETIKNKINLYDNGEYKDMQFKGFFHPFSPDKKPWFNHPINWRKVLEVYPDLNLDLAHFGGLDDLTAFAKGNDSSDNCSSEIVRLCKKYQNVYTDISYTLFSQKANNVINNYILKDHSFMQDKILFGTDFDLVLMDKSIDSVIRDFFLYWVKNNPYAMRKITFDNGVRFLGLDGTI